MNVADNELCSFLFRSTSYEDHSENTLHGVKEISMRFSSFRYRKLLAAMSSIFPIFFDVFTTLRETIFPKLQPKFSNFGPNFKNLRPFEGVNFDFRKFGTLSETKLLFLWFLYPFERLSRV